MRRFAFIPFLLVAALTIFFAPLARGQKPQPAGLPEYLSIPSKKIDLSGIKTRFRERRLHNN